MNFVDSNPKIKKLMKSPEIECIPIQNRWIKDFCSQLESTLNKDIGSDILTLQQRSVDEEHAVQLEQELQN